MFTSRLPISTSVRRPTGHGDGSTSFVRLNRASGIPVTVKKANLFTPQTKRPFSNAASTAKKSYMSGGFATEKKYQTISKPVPDRDQQLRMFETLIEYLKTHAPTFPIPEAKKFFSSVSTTESTRIFEFLIGRILPDFKIAKLEKDVPEALTLLEYPYIRSVTKSALVSVTTRQSAVGLLVIFNWLISTLNQIESTSLDEPDEEDWQSDVRWEIAKINLTEPKNVERGVKQLFERLHPWEDVHTKEQQLRETYEELDKINQYLEDLDELKQEVETLEENTAKMSDYSVQMSKYVETKREEETKQKQEVELADSELETLTQEKQKVFREMECKMITLEADRRVDLENFDAGIMKYQTDIIPTLKRALDRVERDFSEKRSQHEENVLKLRPKIEEEQRARVIVLKKHEDILTALKNKRDSEKEQLDTKRAECETVAKKNFKHLECVLQKNLQQAETIVKDAELEARRWAEACAISEKNNRVAKSALKLFQ